MRFFCTVFFKSKLLLRKTILHLRQLLISKNEKTNNTTSVFVCKYE